MDRDFWGIKGFRDDFEVIGLLRYKEFRGLKYKRPFRFGLSKLFGTSKYKYSVDLYSLIYRC
mgnify:CR=1 FL=1